MLLLGLKPERKKLTPEQRLYRHFCNILEKNGLRREQSQAPGEFARLAAATFPQQAEAILAFNGVYERLCYAVDDETGRENLLRELKQWLGQLRIIS